MATGVSEFYEYGLAQQHDMNRKLGLVLVTENDQRRVWVDESWPDWR